MKNSIYGEKWAKRWLKNRVSVTLAVLVAMMISGGIAYGMDKIPQDEEITEELLKEITDLKKEIEFLKGKVKKVSDGKKSGEIQEKVSAIAHHDNMQKKLTEITPEPVTTMGLSSERSSGSYLSVNCTDYQPVNESIDSIAIGSVASGDQYTELKFKNNVGIGYKAYLEGDGTVGIGSPYINSHLKIVGGTEFCPVTVIGYMNNIGAESIGIGNEMEFNGKDNIAFGTYLYEGYNVDTPKYWEDEEHIAVPIASHGGERGLGAGEAGDRNIVFGNKISLDNGSEHPVENAIVIGNKTKIPANMQQMGDDYHMFRAMPEKISTLSEGTTGWVPLDPEEDPVPVDPVPVDPDLEEDDYYIGIENDVIAIGKMSSSFAKESIGIGNETRSGVGVALGNNARALGAIEFTPSGTYEKEFLDGHSLALGNDSYVNIKNSLSLGYKSEIKRVFTIGELPDPGELPEMGEFSDPGEFPHPGESPDPEEMPEPEEEDWKTTGYLLDEENNDGKNGVISVGKGVLKEDPTPVKSVTLRAAETAEETVTTPEKAINRRIINIADGAYDYDLITIRQLKKLEKDLGLTLEEAQLYLKYAGNRYATGVNPDDAKIDMEEGTLTIKGVTPGKNPNIVTTAQANGVVELELGDTLNIGDGANMVTVGGDEIKNSKVTIDNTGINGGGEKIVNVAAAVNDDEAINYKQMDDKLKDVVVSSGGTPVDIKGTGAAVVTKNTENVYNIHVDKVFQYVDREGQEVVRDGNNFYIFKNGEIDRTKIVAKGDVEVKLVDPYGETIVPVKFGNVADGKIAPDSTELINGGQLYNAMKPHRDFNNAIAANSRGIRKLRKEHNNAIAQMAAMNAVDFAFTTPEKLKVGIGVGGYKGSRAIAVGLAYAPTDYFLLDAKWSSPTNTHHGGVVGIGMTYEFNDL